MWIKSMYAKNDPINFDNIVSYNRFGKDGSPVGIGFNVYGDRLHVTWTYNTEKERDAEYKALEIALNSETINLKFFHDENNEAKNESRI